MVFKRRNKPPCSLASARRSTRAAAGGAASNISAIGSAACPTRRTKIAIGFAAGVFVSFTPLFGLHIVLGAALAWLVRGNIVASLIGTLAGNPVTTPSSPRFPSRSGIASSATGSPAGISAGRRGRSAGPRRASGKAPSASWASAIRNGGKLDLFLYDMVWPYFVGGLLPGLIAAIASPTSPGR